MYYIGEFYEEGKRGFKKNETQALEWYLKAAEKGNIEAMAKVGYFYDKGLGGLNQDKKEALKWYKKNR